MITVLAVLRVGEAREQRQIVGEFLAAMHAGRERAGRTEEADAIAAIDLLVDAEQHRAEHLVGDHLVEPPAGKSVSRATAVAGACRGRSWTRCERPTERGAEKLRLRRTWRRDAQHEGDCCCKRDRCDDEERLSNHGQRPQRMPVKSWPGEAVAKSLTVQRPDAAAQVCAKVHGELFVLLIVTLPPAEVTMAVSPGWVSCAHWKLRVQTVAAPSC